MDENLVLSLLRDRLLALHKILMNVERDTYERIHGKVGAGQFLSLLLSDPQFSWLRKLSEIVVWIDEILDPKEMTAEEETKNVLEQARKLLTPSELGEEFVQKYQRALQNNADAIMAHKEVRDVLKLVP
jgi:hypothetical protein